MRSTLAKILECFAKNDFPGLRRYAAQIPKRAPESALRACVDVADESRSAYLGRFEQAVVQFRHAIYKLRGTGENLRRMMVFMLILSAAWLCDRTANLLKGIQFTKQFRIAAFSGPLGETFGFLLFMFFVLGLVYAVRWWILARVDVHQRHWDYFAAHINSS